MSIESIDTKLNLIKRLERIYMHEKAIFPRNQTMDSVKLEYEILSLLNQIVGYDEKFDEYKKKLFKKMQEENGDA